MQQKTVELLQKIAKFTKKAIVASQHSDLAKIWEKDFVGKDFLQKISRSQWKMVGTVLIAGAFSYGTQKTIAMVEKKSHKQEYAPQLIDFPESLADDGGVLDFSNCPEAFQPGDEGYSKEIVSQPVASIAKAEKTVKIANKILDKSADEAAAKLLKMADNNGISAEVFNHNLELLQRTAKQSVLLIIYFEHFSDAPYLDSAGNPTIAYGLIRYPDERQVKMTDLKISQTLPSELISEHGKNREAMFAKGRGLTERHLKNEVASAILTKVKQPLKESEAVAVASFVYHQGRGCFARSKLLKGINAGDKNCWKELLRHNTINDEWSQACQLRRGIEYLVAVQKILPGEFLNFRASGGYDAKNLELLFDENKLQRVAGKINLPKTDPTSLASFVKSQTGAGVKVKQIMDMKTVRVVEKDLQLAMQYNNKQR